MTAKNIRYGELVTVNAAWARGPGRVLGIGTETVIHGLGGDVVRVTVNTDDGEKTIRGKAEQFSRDADGRLCLTP